MKAGTLATMLGIVAMAGQAMAEDAKKPAEPVFKITPGMIESGDFHAHELCSVDWLRLRGTSAQGRVEAYCKAVEGLDKASHQELDVCRQDKEKRKQEFEAKAGTLDKDKKTDMEIQNEISFGACQNWTIIRREKKTGELFGEHFGKEGIILRYEMR